MKLTAVAPEPIQLTSGELGHGHFTRALHITDVLVGDHHEVLGDAGPRYTVWLIRVIVNELAHLPIHLYKRYSDIERLRNDLVAEFPDEQIPALPPKGALSWGWLTLSELWMEHRRRGLQWFLSNVMLAPKLQHSSVITSFVLSAEGEGRG